MWFGLRVLKAVQLMEVPLLKLWVHHVAMDGIINALVDPGKLDICSRHGIGPHSAVKRTSRTANGITSYCPAISIVSSHFLIMYCFSRYNASLAIFTLLNKSSVWRYARAAVSADVWNKVVSILELLFTTCPFFTSELYTLSEIDSIIIFMCTV